MNVAADAPSTWTGAVNVSGNGLLEFGGTNQIGAIAGGAQINLYGPQAIIAAPRLGTAGNTALTGLTGNAGYLTLQSGAALTTSGGLTNNGALNVDNGGSGGSSLTVDGTLTNSNYVQVGNGYVAGTLTAQGLSNTGTIGIYGTSTDQALLSVVGDAPPIWTGTVNVSGNGLLEFGGTSQIGAIASGASISLDGTQAFIAAASLGTAGNTALTGTRQQCGLALDQGRGLRHDGGRGCQ